jgi:hypothetical protein
MTPEGKWFPRADELPSFSRCVETNPEGSDQVRRKIDPAEVRPDAVKE